MANQTSGVFSVQIRVDPGDPVDNACLVRAVRKVGGQESASGFQFASYADREAALEILGDRFGSRYFRRSSCPDDRGSNPDGASQISGIDFDWGRKMKKLRSILLATDLDPRSRNVVPVVATLARTFGASVTLLHAIDSKASPWNPPDYRASAMIALQEVESELAAQSVVTDETQILTGDPVETILAKADEVAAGLIVIGTANQSETCLTFGPIADQLVSQSTLPVLAIHPSQRSDRFGNILCPVEMSQSSTRNLETSVELASAFNSFLTVLTVVPRMGWVPQFPNSIAKELQRKHEQTWKEQFVEFSQAVDFKGVVREEVCASGVPPREIVGTAKAKGSDLIVMGTGRSVLHRVLMGSVTRRVTQQLPCSILIIRNVDFLDDWPEAELSTIRILLAEGDAFLGAAENGSAIRKFTRVLAKDPYCLRALEGMAAAHQGLGETTQAGRWRHRADLLRNDHVTA